MTNLPSRGGKKDERDRPPAPVTPSPRPRISGRQWAVVIGLSLLFNLIFYFGSLSNRSSTPQVTISYSRLTALVDAHRIKNALVRGEQVQGDFRDPYKTDGKSYQRFDSTVLTDLQ